MDGAGERGARPCRTRVPLTAAPGGPPGRGGRDPRRDAVDAAPGVTRCRRLPSRHGRTRRTHRHPRRLRRRGRHVRAAVPRLAARQPPGPGDAGGVRRGRPGRREPPGRGPGLRARSCHRPSGRAGGRGLRGGRLARDGRAGPAGQSRAAVRRGVDGGAGHPRRCAGRGAVPLVRHPHPAGGTPADPRGVPPGAGSRRPPAHRLLGERRPGVADAGLRPRGRARPPVVARSPRGAAARVGLAEVARMVRAPRPTDRRQFQEVHLLAGKA